MKAVLLSIHPKWCEKICHEIGTEENGKPIYEKSIEVRKTKPSIPTPFKVYIYCTNQKINGEILLTYDKKVEGRNRGFRENGDIPLAGKVIGEFVCDKIEEFSVGSLRSDDIENLACLSYSEMIDYFYKPEELDGKTAKHGYAWHISQLKIYDTPKELKEFKKPCSYKGLCFSCKRAHFYGDGSFVCTNKVTRPPQSWMYVQE
nr:MAG TPA: protein of unknown function DUF365 [Caudoviricetes sp.]